MRVTSILFWVQENHLSEKFYRKIGFEVTRGDDRYSVVRLGDFEIQLVNIRDEELFVRDSMSGDRGRGVYVYIRVEDGEQKYKDLRQMGITPHTEPRDWEWGNREFIVKDPDGYKLCFWQPVQGVK